MPCKSQFNYQFKEQYFQPSEEYKVKTSKFGSDYKFGIDATFPMTDYLKIVSQKNISKLMAANPGKKKLELSDMLTKRMGKKITAYVAALGIDIHLTTKSFRALRCTEFLIRIKQFD